MSASAIIACPSCRQTYTVPQDGRKYSCRCGAVLPLANPAAESRPNPPAPPVAQPAVATCSPCPFCGSTLPRRRRVNLSPGGWALFLILIFSVAGWVLAWIPWVWMREDSQVCSACQR